MYGYVHHEVNVTHVQAPPQSTARSLIYPLSNNLNEAAAIASYNPVLLSKVMSAQEWLRTIKEFSAITYAPEPDPTCWDNDSHAQYKNAGKFGFQSCGWVVLMTTLHLLTCGLSMCMCYDLHKGYPARNKRRWAQMTRNKVAYLTAVNARANGKYHWTYVTTTSPHHLRLDIL